jgi:hypothetical protein
MKRLRDRMREDLTLRGMSTATIDSYVRCARKCARGGRHRRAASWCAAARRRGKQKVIPRFVVDASIAKLTRDPERILAVRVRLEP